MKRAYRKSDFTKNPVLADEMATLRGGITEAAERYPLPLRFDAIENPDRPSMIITDLTTGRQTEVPLFGYGAVRQALNDLFGG